MQCYGSFYLNIWGKNKIIFFLFFNVYTIDIPKKLCDETPSNTGIATLAVTDTNPSTTAQKLDVDSPTAAGKLDINPSTAAGISCTNPPTAAGTSNYGMQYVLLVVV